MDSSTSPYGSAPDEAPASPGEQSFGDAPAGDPPAGDPPAGGTGAVERADALPVSDAVPADARENAEGGAQGESWHSEAVGSAAQALASVEKRELAEHPDAFGEVHGELQRALADIDDA